MICAADETGSRKTRSLNVQVLTEKKKIFHFLNYVPHKNVHISIKNYLKVYFQTVLNTNTHKFGTNTGLRVVKFTVP